MAIKCYYLHDCIEKSIFKRKPSPISSNIRKSSVKAILSFSVTLAIIVLV